MTRKSYVAALDSVLKPMAQAESVRKWLGCSPRSSQDF